MDGIYSQRPANLVWYKEHRLIYESKSISNNYQQYPKTQVQDTVKYQFSLANKQHISKINKFL